MTSVRSFAGWLWRRQPTEGSARASAPCAGGALRDGFETECVRAARSVRQETSHPGGFEGASDAVAGQVFEIGVYHQRVCPGAPRELGYEAPAGLARPDREPTPELRGRRFRTTSSIRCSSAWSSGSSKATTRGSRDDAEGRSSFHAAGSGWTAVGGARGEVHPCLRGHVGPVGAGPPGRDHERIAPIGFEDRAHLLVEQQAALDAPGVDEERQARSRGVPQLFAQFEKRAFHRLAGCGQDARRARTRIRAPSAGRSARRT